MTVRVDIAALGRMWIVGCGKLGQALLAGWMEAGLRAADVIAIDPTEPVLPAGVQWAPQPGPELARADVILLAVKPQKLPEVAPLLAPYVEGALVLSVLAGASVANLEAKLPGARIVRALPNTAARVRRAATLLVAGAGATEADREAAAALMGAIGQSWWVAENQMDAAGAVTGSGPAFLFRFIEALGAAGRASGLPEELSDALALQMVAGAAELAARDARPPSALREEVTSPNGMTQAGLEVLDGTGALSTLLRDTVRAAARRSAELAKEAE